MLPPDPLRCLALLDLLHVRLGPAGFGRALQTLLGFTLREAGFHVVRNAVGVPDLVATRDDGPGFALEVKTGEGAITLTARDLEGVLRAGHAPVVAALRFPHPAPGWLLVDARELGPGTYPKHVLARRRAVGLGFDVDAGFRTTLARYHAVAMQGTDVLDGVFFGGPGAR